VLPIGGTVILVREEDAGRARELIEEYRRAPGADDSDEDPDSSLNETQESET
jgi:hypothetical protein